MATASMPLADAGAADVSLDATIDSAFEELGSAETTQETPAETPTETTDVQADPLADTTEQPASTETQQASPNDPYPLGPDGSYAVPKADFNHLQGVKQYAEAVQQRFPTAQDAEVAYMEASDFRAILSDIQHGGEPEIDAVMQFLAGQNSQDPYTRQAMQAGFERMASRMPAMLQKVNPQAHQKLIEGAIQSKVEDLYKRAAETGDPKDLQRAQHFDWGFSERYKTELQKVDPQQAELDRIAQERQQMETMRGDMLQRDWTNYNRTAVDGPKWTQFNAEIDKILAPVKASYDEIVFNALRKDIADQVLNKVGADYEFSRRHQGERKEIEKAFQSAWTNRQPLDAIKPRVDAYTANFLARVRQHVSPIAKPLIEKAAVSKPAARPATPQQSPQKPTQRAANGQFQPQNHAVKLKEDPEFSAMFQ
jgi:hypothetical protein